MSQKTKILNLLSDGQYHSALEINTPEVAGYHGSQRVYDLKKDGYKIDCELATKVIPNYQGNPKIMAYKLLFKVDPEKPKLKPNLKLFNIRRKQ